MSSNANRSSRKWSFQGFRSSSKRDPTSSPSEPSGTPTDNPTPPGDDSGSSTVPATNFSHSVKRRKFESGESDALRILVKALKALETGVGIFPPLKAAVSELVACTTHIQIAEESRKEYDQLASNLADLVQSLQIHLPDSKPRWIPYSIENVARSINEQVAHIKEQQDRSRRSRVAESLDDGDIIECYRRIEHTVRQLQIDISLSVWDLVHQQWANTTIKELNPVHDARYNAALSVDMQRHGCTLDTRVSILKEAIEWTRRVDTARIYWMNGMAGTGKTTIAYSLCERLEESKQLGACFFCSRPSPLCRNVNNIVPTIAYQLARFSNPYQNELCQVLTNKPDIAKRALSTQFIELIVKPLLQVKDTIPSDVIILIDGLDECSGERETELIFDRQGTQQVLELLFAHAAALPVKFFVTSRPEPGILRKFDGSKDTRRFILHDVEESLVHDDIRTFLQHALKDIETNQEDIERLAARAGRLFIFAATAVRYIEPSDPALNHRRRLETILSEHSTPDRVYRALDALYSTILSQALLSVNGEEGEIRRLVLHTVIGAKEPLTASALAEITGIESEATVELALLPFQSVLRSSGDLGVVSTLHASFPDYMLDPTRSGGFYCDSSKQNAYMATRCFEIMNRSLRFNICNLETSCRLDEDVPNIQQRIIEAISPGLSYASYYWGSHMYSGNYSNELATTLDRFLRYQLLFWMEVLSLKNVVGSAAAILLEAFKSLPHDSMNELRNMLQDSRNFTTTYAAGQASLSTPHIYISSLPLAPAQSFIRKAYWPRMKGLVHIEATAIEDRNDRPLAIWATGSREAKVALSKDGRRILSGADNGTIIVRGVSNGRCLLGPLQKHNGIVWAVAFSPDGSKIASGSHDRTIYISNADTGATLVGPLTGHTDLITFLSFSPDGTCLASASGDCTIRIWDPFTGSQIGELNGHQACVMCVVFSSEGKYLVSCSDDHTIRVWDWRQGTTVTGPFEGHTDWVDCVALSPDDALIASCGRDCTVRIWKAATGKTVVGPLTGHTDRVFSIAFSPDGMRVVSGSFDKTIRVWSSETGELIAGPFRGHEDDIRSVLFSADGTHIISGSDDSTICIWDASRSISGKESQLFGHTRGILAIVLSPDGTRIVSGSNDHKICIWDTASGNLILGPLIGHTEAVWSVAYTPDGTTVVSGSADCTIRTWDAHTGSALASPLAQHTETVLAVAVSPDGQLVVSGSWDELIRIWDLHTGREVAYSPLWHLDLVGSVEFSPNGLYIASASNGCSIHLWDVNTGSLLVALDQHTDPVMSARFSPDSSKLVSGSSGGTIIVWDVNMGTVLSGPWKGHDDVVRAVAFSPNGAAIASGSEDHTIRLWSTNTGTILAAPFRGHTDWVTSVAFTPDGKHIVSGSQDCTIRLWDLGIEDHIPHQESDDWAAEDNGWIKDSESRMVLWLPPDLKRITPVPPCSLVISPKGAVRANLKDMIYGDYWMDCYVTPSDSDVTDI